ncbi:MAG: ATPase [Sphingomonadaceae bacterium]|nr:ATPase [Sphingomonadaceae bacterium]
MGAGRGKVAAIAVAVLGALGVLVLLHQPLAAVATLVAAVSAALLGAPTVRRIRAADTPSTPPTPRIDDVLEAIVEPVLLVAQGRVTIANRAARQLLGAHVVGQDVRLAIRHPAAAERLAAPAGEAAAEPLTLVGVGGLDQRWEMRITDTPDGYRVVHLIDQTGNYAAERMRVDFVANASHELRTPLASILGFIETLSDEAGDDPMIRGQFLKVRFDEARRMQRLVEDLISLSRIEAEKYRLPDRAVDLADLIEEIRAELNDTGDPRACDIVIDVDMSVPAVNGDRVQLSQALHNLIGNAMKYGRAGTPVTVRLWQDLSGMARISVEDEGDGIPPEHIPRLTERFYRVDAGRSRTLGGTGLGLAIVKHIIERHRGRLDIASTLGRGTTVTVLMPFAEPLSSGRNESVTRPRVSL